MYLALTQEQTHFCLSSAKKEGDEIFSYLFISNRCYLRYISFSRYFSVSDIRLYSCGNCVCVCVWPALTSSVASSQLLAAKRSQWIVETCKSVRGSGGAVAAVQPRPSSLHTLFPPHVFLLFVSEWKKITSSDGGAAGRRSAAEISLSCVYITVWVGVKVETVALVQIQHVSAHQFITATFQLFVRVTFSGRKMSDICWRVWW